MKLANAIVVPQTESAKNVQESSGETGQKASVKVFPWEKGKVQRQRVVATNLLLKLLSRSLYLSFKMCFCAGFPAPFCFSY